MQREYLFEKHYKIFTNSPFRNTHMQYMFQLETEFTAHVLTIDIWLINILNNNIYIYLFINYFHDLYAWSSPHFSRHFSHPSTFKTQNLIFMKTFFQEF